MLDIGGGSLEIAAGLDEEPDVAISLPLGAARLTRDWLTGNPPAPEQVRRLRKHVRTEIARRAADVARAGTPDRAVATSKTFRQLARIARAAPSEEGPYVRRAVTHADVTDAAKRLPAMTADQRAQLPGVSLVRAPQLAAGASWRMRRWTCSGLRNWRSAPGAARGRPAAQDRHAGYLTRADLGLRP